MEIGQKFNKLTLKEYFFYIDNQKRYTDFNTLGLYRSIIENNKLDFADKIEVRDYAHRKFKKTFDFLQLKDMYFQSDKDGHSGKIKSDKRKSERKKEKQMITTNIATD